MLPLQELIHRLEEGAGRRWILMTMGILVAITMVTVYDTREFRNLGTVEGMDAAQLARNLADGKGYTTDFVRPVSMWLLKQKATDGGTKAPGPDVYRLRGAHPDLANPPVYPLLLAAWMKVIPFHHPIASPTGFWIYQPDLMIAFLNQLCFLGAAVLVYFLGRRVFDPSVGWVSAIVFFCTEEIWRYSVSGLPTLLMVVIFLGTILMLVRLEEGVRGEQKGPGWVLMMAGLAGLLIGLGALTRYSFGWLILPVVGYLLLFLGPQRILAAVVAVVVFLAVLSPWVARNYSVSGTLFGIGGYALAADAGVSSRKVEASLDPSEDLKKFGFQGVRIKLVSNLTTIVRDELPKLGGSWVTGLFLAGLLIPFRSQTLGRLRVLVLMCLAVLMVVQALGKTHLSSEGSQQSSENVLALATPVVFIFGVGMFFILLEQLRLTTVQGRLLVIVAFVVLVSAPMILTLLPPRTIPHVYPPYYPPVIQQTSGWVAENELMMSDIPEAVAWYGRRHCVGFTWDLEKHFYEINDFHRPIAALYLTPVTMDGKLLSQMLGPETRAWGLFLLESLIRREVHARFPLRVAAPGFFPDRLSDQLFLTDGERWAGRLR